jgi:DNA helicase-2/ATP-dependent DNA helicase PcrA
MAITPTPDQLTIINEPSNCVIGACPGSGKTFVVSEKIKTILPKLPDYKGVIAISFTNKASNELRDRCLRDGLDPKGSFFGTIDSFELSELIYPFARHLYGIPEYDFEVLDYETVKAKYETPLDDLPDDGDFKNFLESHFNHLGDLYARGIIVLELIGVFALHIFHNSRASRNYLKAKYSHVFIDEYQDSGVNQHRLFLELEKLGLIAVAVGDINQSIYGFAGRKPDFLISLMRMKEFITLPLNYNHRCHPSIVNYSLRLLNKESKLLPSDQKRIFRVEVTGDEKAICEWISKQVPKFIEKWCITKLSDVAVLVRSKHSGERYDQNIKLPHKYVRETPLDKDISVWSNAFERILKWIFSADDTITEILEDLQVYNSLKPTGISWVQKQCKDLRSFILSDNFEIIKAIDKFVIIVKTLFPKSENEKSKHLLKEVLSDSILLDTYKPVDNNQIQLLTLHKAKGLEFDLVFHVDLYDWIIPAKIVEDGDIVYDDYQQCLNLHYVGVTRARKACILCHSTYRHNGKNERKNGKKSEFFDLPTLGELRLKLT